MNSKLKLGINIDHVATIRNARGVLHPEPLKAALIAQNAGADNITAHLREDRRHISDIDIKKLVKTLRIPLNLEMAPTNEMLNIAISSKVNRVCLVPEKRKVEQLFFDNEEIGKKILNSINKENKFKEIAEKEKEKNISYIALGLVEKEQLFDEFADQVFKLKENEFSKLIKTDIGWHILKVTEIIKSKSKKLLMILYKFYRLIK